MALRQTGDPKLIPVLPLSNDRLARDPGALPARLQAATGGDP